MFTVALYLTMLFGTVEMGWLYVDRNALANGTSRAARLGATGSTTTAIKQAVRDGSHINLDDSWIVIESNSASDCSGTWSTVSDNAGGTANAVSSGMPLRVRVVGWPHKLLAGRLFIWLPGVSNGGVPLHAAAVLLRE
jgi:Flp pilus assembly protein TadG